MRLIGQAAVEGDFGQGLVRVEQQGARALDAQFHYEGVGGKPKPDGEGAGEMARAQLHLCREIAHPHGGVDADGKVCHNALELPVTQTRPVAVGETRAGGRHHAVLVDRSGVWLHHVLANGSGDPE
jgi:hypothetical protein